MTTTCPNCGHVNPASQRFCGNCGTDVQAAAPHGTPISEQQSAPYAYSAPSAYGYDQPYDEPSKKPMRLILIGVVVVFALCCAFACGLLLGFEIIPTMLGVGATPKPTPKVTPTPQSMLMILQYLIG